LALHLNLLPGLVPNLFGFPARIFQIASRIFSVS
jgi:hypothetical protein